MDWGMQKAKKPKEHPNINTNNILNYLHHLWYMIAITFTNAGNYIKQCHRQLAGKANICGDMQNLIVTQYILITHYTFHTELYMIIQNLNVKLMIVRFNYQSANGTSTVPVIKYTLINFLARWHIRTFVFTVNPSHKTHFIFLNWQQYLYHIVYFTL